MIVVGALVERAANGVNPVDGGVAIWRDGDFVFGMAEERATRRKYAGGFRSSLAFGLDQLGIGYADVDAFAFVSYGEPHSRDIAHILNQAPELADHADRVHIAGRHHDVHAYGAARLAPWDNSLILVLDNEGLILGAQMAEVVESNAMERASYYVSSSESVDLVTRDLFGRSDVSLGEAYRRFTYYCGFPSHQFAGKAMALAAFGDPTTFGDVSVFSSDGGPIHVDMDGAYSEPARSVVDFFARHGRSIAPPRVPGAVFEQDHLDVAAFIQRELERAVTTRARSLLKATGQRSLCVTGGVAYNCRLIAHLESELGVPVFVPPSPGDQGLGIGAVHAYLAREGLRHVKAAPSVRLGGVRGAQVTEVSDFAKQAGATVHRAESNHVYATEAAEVLLHAGVVAVVDGASEFGRRALGARSLIALPDPSAMDRLRGLKRREWFRPFGVSMLRSLAVDTFGPDLPDPWMLRAPRVRNRESVNSVIHRDSTLRAQIVEDSDDSVIAEVLRVLVGNGIAGVVVNTSFNLDNEPIVETDSEALTLFARHEEISLLILANSGCYLRR